MEYSANEALATYMELAREKFRLNSNIYFESQDRNQKIATARKVCRCLTLKNLHIPWQIRNGVNKWLNAELLKAYGV